MSNDPSATPVEHVTIFPLPNLQLKSPQFNSKTDKTSVSLFTPNTFILASKAQRNQRVNQLGFSLLEMSVVVLILSTIAAIAMPNLSSTDTIKLDTAAEVVAKAIRFARAETIRTKISRGIFTDATNERIRVYSLPGSSPVYDIYHPIDKKLYDIQLKSDAFVAGVNLVGASFAFTGTTTSSTNLEFNAEGNPKITNSGTDYLLSAGTITLSYQGQQLTISIAPVTGRVTVQ